MVALVLLCHFYKFVQQLNTDLMQQDTFVKYVDYTLGKILGKGGNGQVYEVSILSDRSKKVVVKRVKLFPC